MTPNTQSRRALALCLAAAPFAVGAPLAHASNASGETLAGEMSCLACHQAPAAAQERIGFRPAPLLGAGGLQLTPQWLRDFLKDPQTAKPGTAMPDALHAMAPEEKAAAAEALTHYLVSLQTPNPALVYSGSSIIERGRLLYHSIGCVACHAPQELPNKAPSDARAKAELGELAANSVPLGNPAMKMTVAQMASFLLEPAKFHPAGRMPSLKLSASEAYAIAAYIQRDQAAANAPQSAPGLAYEYYEESFTELPDFARLTPKAAGVAEHVDLTARKRDTDFGFRFTGEIAIEKGGTYTFFIKSADGSQLFIDEKLVVDNGGVHKAQEKRADAKLAPGRHAISIIYFSSTKDFELSASWQGPGVKKDELPLAALSHPAVPMVPAGTDPAFTLDPAKAARGKALFTSLNCAACHQAELNGTLAANAKPLAQLDLAKPESCIAEKAGKNQPQFALGFV